MLPLDDRQRKPAAMNILDHQGPIGVPDRTTLIDSVATALPTIVAIIAFAFWLRQANTRAADRLEFAYSEPRLRPQTALANHLRSSRGRRPPAVFIGMTLFPPITKMTSGLIAFGASCSKAGS
jgi:hypothetical protein